MEAVTLKGTANGFIIVLDPSLPFADLLIEMEQKITSASAFLGKEKKGLMFKGRDLSDEEESALVKVIAEHSEMRIVCVLKEDHELDEKFTGYMAAESKKAEALVEKDKNTTQQTFDKNAYFDGNALIHKGNIRSGQSLSSENNIIILGDVNPGGTVISDGCIFVYGSLLGSATAGASGNTDAFIMANDFHPLQVRIADVIAISQKEEAGKSGRFLVRFSKTISQGPEVCYLVHGGIAREMFSDSFIKKQNYFK